MASEQEEKKHALKGSKDNPIAARCFSCQRTFTYIPYRCPKCKSNSIYPPHLPPKIETPAMKKGPAMASEQDDLINEIMVALAKGTTGKEARVALQEILTPLMQQLAQAREELRIALAQRQDYRAENAQARALLEPIGTRVPERHGEPICIYCYEILSEGATLGHKEDCLWLRIRAFLGKEA